MSFPTTVPLPNPEICTKSVHPARGTKSVHPATTKEKEKEGVPQNSLQKPPESPEFLPSVPSAGGGSPTAPHGPDRKPGPPRADRGGEKGKEKEKEKEGEPQNSLQKPPESPDFLPI